MMKRGESPLVASRIKTLSKRSVHGNIRRIARRAPSPSRLDFERTTRIRSNTEIYVALARVLTRIISHKQRVFFATLGEARVKDTVQNLNFKLGNCLAVSLTCRRRSGSGCHWSLLLPFVFFEKTLPSNSSTFLDCASLLVVVAIRRCAAAN